jgi:hypothetical protein
MLLNIELTPEEVNVVLSSLNVGLVEKIKTQAIMQLQATQVSESVVEEAKE